ncbi:hypothetical protein BMN22_005153 [Escherichia coli]|nr:hypothetical protein [Escherichia coli]
MENYIEELEAERIEELEAYLRVTGLTDNKLTANEESLISLLDKCDELCGGGGCFAQKTVACEWGMYLIFPQGSGHFMPTH